MPLSPARRVAVAAVVALGLTACAPTDGPTPSDSPTLTVAAAFYPLEYVAGRVGGDQVRVIDLTPPGTEPHDLELSPKGVREIRGADVVLYLSTFQPAIDDAIASTRARALDAVDVLSVRYPDVFGFDPTSIDPHFWLDPTLLAAYGDATAEEFATLDPAHADDYRENAALLTADLLEVDSEYAAGLASCERDTLLVSHEAFAYLAARYGLIQVGLSGVNPDAEPSPARIREVRDLAQSIGATTVFVETLVDPSVVQAFARDAGLDVLTLDPIGGLVQAGDDYLVIMRRNLDALTTALGCG